MGDEEPHVKISRMIQHIAQYLGAHAAEKHTSLKFSQIINKNPYIDPKSQNDLTSLYHNITKNNPEERLEAIVSGNNLSSLTKKDYTFVINWNSSEPFNPEDDVVDVRIITKNSEEYSADFVTRKHFDYLFDKNKRTGECSNGTYFCMPGMIVVENITDENISNTIEDLIKNKEIEEYFRKV